MDIQHTTKGFELTDSIREHAEEKMRRGCSQVSNLPGVHMHINYEIVGHQQHGDNRGVNVVLFVPNGEPLKASEVGEDLYAMMDKAAKDIERQVRRYREKHVSRRS